MEKVIEHAKYGIATVQPNGAIRKCRIRNLRVEYFLSPIEVLLVTPKSCAVSDKKNDCTDDFVIQIIDKAKGGKAIQRIF